MIQNRLVVLVNPNIMKPAVAPLGLELVGEALQREGYEVMPLDLCFEPNPTQAVSAKLCALDPLAVAVSLRNTDDCYLASQQSFIPQLTEVVAAIRGQTSAPVIVGGSGYSVAPAAILRECRADYGVVGDGERALPELLEHVSEGKRAGGINGVVWRDADQIRASLPSYHQLWDTPPAERKLFDNERYFREGGQGSLETKRGCDSRCIYCADPLSKGRNHRPRNPQAVADEIKGLVARGINCLHVCDSEFNIPPDHAVEVCREMGYEGLTNKVTWYTYASPEGFSETLAIEMRRAGCVGIDFGADSGDREMLKRLGRDFRPDDIAECVRLCRRQGIAVMLDLLLGGPGETKDSVRRTISFAKGLEVDCVGVSLGVRLYPGTKLAEETRRQGSLHTNPDLQGEVLNNEDLLRPIFYLSSDLGDDPAGFVRDQVGGDERFFFGGGGGEEDYNYNENQRLVEAIASGARGAYWHILSKLRSP